MTDSLAPFTFADPPLLVENVLPAAEHYPDTLGECIAFLQDLRRFAYRTQAVEDRAVYVTEAERLDDSFTDASPDEAVEALRGGDPPAFEVRAVPTTDDLRGALLLNIPVLAFFEDGPGVIYGARDSIRAFRVRSDGRDRVIDYADLEPVLAVAITDAAQVAEPLEPPPVPGFQPPVEEERPEAFPEADRNERAAAPAEPAPRPARGKDK